MVGFRLLTVLGVMAALAGFTSLAQAEDDGGKKKHHAIKNLLRINAALMILFLSDTYEGSVHDKRIADATR